MHDLVNDPAPEKNASAPRVQRAGSEWQGADAVSGCAKGFGMLIDQFGTPWIVNAGQIIGS